VSALGVLPGPGDAGPLQSLLEADGVTDVLVNGGGAVWVDRGDGLEAVPLRLGGEEAVRTLAVRLAAQGGRRLDAAAPWVDVRLPGGVRLHAVLAPVAPEGTCLSLRVLRDRGLPLAELVGDAGCAALLEAIVLARLALVVTGGTGSGKTTLLSALLSCVDPAERLVLVEDAGELRPRLPHVVRLEARPANVEGAGGITLRDLVRQALRMRPDRIVVGEVRGAEVSELLLALNTGHEGGATTLHANGAADVPARLEALGALAGMPRDALHAQAAAALHVVVHLRRDPRVRGGRRRVTEVGLVGRSLAGGLVVEVAATVGAGGLVQGPAASALARLLAARGADARTLAA
jgi:pilus assembly protein CpaF